MTPLQKLSRLGPRKTLENFEEAVREHAWLGSKHPEDQLYIERLYHKRKAALLKVLGLDYVMPTDDEDD